MATKTAMHERDRDEFLLAVVAELKQGNERWPGLWIRLESLLNEKERLRDALREIADGLENEHQPEPYLRIAWDALGEAKESIRCPLCSRTAKTMWPSR